MKKNNIILIGMPGAGKSTVGVVLAKTLGMEFLDTDLVIQKREKQKLQTIINSQGMEKLLDVEKEAVLSVDCGNHVIATGGSVVYREEAMTHLKALGTIIYLDVSYEEIERRVNNINTRGIAIRDGATLKDVYKERSVLYEKYRDISIACDGKSIEGVIEEVIKTI